MLEIDPAAVPVPALKYRLLPSSADLNPGDAAPIYLRVRYMTPDGLWNQITPNSTKWRDVPLDQFPTAEVRKFMEQWSGQLEQLEFGARRATCDWNYTVPEQRLDVIRLALGDAQQMRECVRLLDLKARLEIAEGKFDQAVRTIETGLAFSRHIAEGPFLINGLIGLAGTWVMLGRCEELIAQPGTPEPLLGPVLIAEPGDRLPARDRQRAEALREHDPRAGRGRGRTAPDGRRMGDAPVADARPDRELGSRLHGAGGEGDGGLGPRAVQGRVAPGGPGLPEGAARPGRHRRAGMSDDQAIAIFLAGRRREIWDDLFKASHLPARTRSPSSPRPRSGSDPTGPLS